MLFRDKLACFYLANIRSSLFFACTEEPGGSQPHFEKLRLGYIVKKIMAVNLNVPNKPNKFLYADGVYANSVCGVSVCICLFCMRVCVVSVVSGVCVCVWCVVPDVYACL
jgi:hypothetical protein